MHPGLPASSCSSPCSSSPVPLFLVCGCPAQSPEAPRDAAARWWRRTSSRCCRCSAGSADAPGRPRCRSAGAPACRGGWDGQGSQIGDGVVMGSSWQPCSSARRPRASRTPQATSQVAPCQRVMFVEQTTSTLNPSLSTPSSLAAREIYVPLVLCLLRCRCCRRRSPLLLLLPSRSPHAWRAAMCRMRDCCCRTAGRGQAPRRAEQKPGTGGSRDALPYAEQHAVGVWMSMECAGR